MKCPLWTGTSGEERIGLVIGGLFFIGPSVSGDWYSINKIISVT
jgi:hypothetical protein